MIKILKKVFSTKKTPKEVDKKYLSTISYRNEGDIEIRRSNRMASVIGILAMTITGLFVVFKILVRVVNIWPSTGFMYQYFHISATMLFASFLLVVWFVIRFCLDDLPRYNLLDENHKKYDAKSDKSFENFIKISKFCFGILVLVSGLLVPFSLIDTDTKLGLITGVIAFIFIIILYFICVLKDIFKFFIKFFLINSFIALIVYYLVLNIIVLNNGTINVEYSSDGTIDICQQADTWADISISVYTVDDDLIWQKEIKDDELLTAEEEKFVGNSNSENATKSKGVDLSKEVLYSSYQLKLDDIVSKNGKYKIEIIFKKVGGEIHITNSFRYNDNDTYTYAKNSISKEI